MNIKATIIAASFLTVSNIQAAEWSGFAALDLRLFAEPAAFSGQNTSFADPSVLVQPEFRQGWNNGADRFTAIPFGRYDSLDSNRSHWDIREFNWLHKGDGWNLQAGVGRLFWGVTESRHLIDIVNQADFVENINSEEKLGQPMLNLNIPTRYGNFNLLYLPYFRERTFPAANGRVRFELPVDTDNPNLNGISHFHPDWAMRWSRTFGDWDVGIAHFSGVGREPRLAPYFPDGSPFPTALIPTYDLINQTSLDVQGALGNWLLKLEAMTRSGQGSRFAAVVAGAEYTQYGIFESSAELGLLMEYQYDGRDTSTPRQASDAPPTPADNDVFLGTRLSLNDEQNTQLLLGVTVDLNTQATVVSFEGSRRLDDVWRIELESRLFKNIPSTDILTGMSQDDYVQIRLTRFF
jgi:hypothetical protein